jgi:hypothetical protein
MFFINRGNFSFLILALVILVFFVLINFLPYILLIGGIIWIINYVYKKFKSRNLGRDPKVEVKKGSFDTSKNDEFNAANVIDVEYTEIK